MAAAAIASPGSRKPQSLEPVVAVRTPLDIARQRLATHCHRDLHRVRCYCDGESVVLIGAVRTYYLKQLAQEIVRRVEGIGAIDNRLVVASPQAAAAEIVA